MALGGAGQGDADTGTIVDVAGGDRLARAGEDMASVDRRIVNISLQRQHEPAGLRFLQVPESAINPHARSPRQFAR